MNDQFPNVNFEQNSYRASEYENAFDELAMHYLELLDGNGDNIEEALNLIFKYTNLRDELGFTDFQQDEDFV